MLEKWKSVTDSKKLFGVQIYQRRFDYLSHDLLISELNAYGFSISALRFGYSYLKNRM